METSWWQAALITLAIALVAGVILLVLEHRSPWFARFQESVRRKQDSLSKSVNNTAEISVPISNATAPETTVNQTVPSASEYKKHPLPEEIRDQIDQAEGFKEHMAERYSGVKVEWLLIFGRLDEIDGNAWLVWMRSQQDYLRPVEVYCHVDFSKYPEFKTLKLKSKVWVTGEISQAYSRLIVLNDCAFRFV